MRSYKLGEFVAHEGAVNCLRIGRNTAGVLATGGEDKKVNLWRIGQHESAIKTLSGLQSPVECVNFDATENQVAAGTANGTVKVWDLDSGKVHRSLVGHRSNCLSLEFHPFGPFLASGSLDTNVKVWDLRRKEAIVTFKGHSAGVTKLAVSPDGKWLCSGSEDGDVKLWDVMSGRPVKDGWRHEGRVTGLEFHPAEFLLATSSADRTVKVWDLDTWEQVDGLGPEATGVQAIAYHRDGRALLSATADGLKVWGVEPAVHHDTVPMDWRHLRDMHLSYKDDAPRAVGCCAHGSSVGIFLVDLRKVAPFCHGAAAAGSQRQQPAGIGSGGAMPRTHAAAGQQQHRADGEGGGSPLSPALLPGYNSSSLQPAAGKRLPPLQQASERVDDTSSLDKPSAFYSRGVAADTKAPEQSALAAAGPLTRQLPRQRTPPAAIGPGAPGSGRPAGSRPGAALQATPPFVAAGSPQPGQLATPPGGLQQHQQQVKQQPDASPVSRGGDFFPEVEIRVPARRPSAAGLDEAAAAGSGLSRPNSSSSRGRSAGDDADADAGSQQLASNLAALHLEQEQAAISSKQQANSSSSSRRAGLAAVLSRPASAKSAAAAAGTAASSAPVSRGASRGSSAVASRAASAHDLGAPGVTTRSGTAAAAPPPAPAAPAADPILAAMAARPGLRSELSRLTSGLAIARGFVSRGNLEGAYKAAFSSGEPALAAMLLEAVGGRPDAFELASLKPLLKLVELLLGSGHEAQVGVGLATLGLVLRGPGQTVAEVCASPKPVGVDLSYEARRSKCLLLKMALEGLGLKLGVLARSGGPGVSARAQMLAAELRRIAAAGGGA